MEGGFSVSDLEVAGISGTTPATAHSPRGRSGRRRSYRSLVVALPPAANRSVTPGFFYDSFDDEEPHHFLDSCFLCKKPLGSNRDIFMYRGDTPFCSEECRQEQIEMDEAEEKNKKLSSLMDQKQKKATATSPSKAQRLHFRPGTVVAG